QAFDIVALRVDARKPRGALPRLGDAPHRIRHVACPSVFWHRCRPYPLRRQAPYTAMLVTIIAEILLAAAALWGTRIAYRGNAPIAAAGFFFIAAAALAGIAEYAGLHAFAPLHGALSSASGWAALALIAAGGLGGPVLMILAGAVLVIVATIFG